MGARRQAARTPRWASGVPATPYAEGAPATPGETAKATRRAVLRGARTHSDDAPGWPATARDLRLRDESSDRVCAIDGAGRYLSNLVSLKGPVRGNRAAASAAKRCHGRILGRPQSFARSPSATLSARVKTLSSRASLSTRNTVSPTAARTNVPSFLRAPW